ncbi:MAG: hypothetical protein RBU37_07445, partial [Myxococcota bacterium]|nr:hypothetical protein [Myxococcota bacterium]
MKTTLPLLCLILVLGMACDPPGVKTPPKLADQNPQQAGNNEASVQAQPHKDASLAEDLTRQSDGAPIPSVDEAPLLERKLTTPALQHKDAVQVEASASFCSQDHCYLSFDHNASSVFHINPRSDTHVFAVPDNSRILVRLVSGTLPERLELDLYASTSWERWSPVEHTPLIVNTTKASTDQGLQSSFFAALSRWFGQRHPSTPFDAFASGRLSLLGGRNNLNQRASDLDSLMDLYTGMQSIDEALQIDRGLQLSSTNATAGEPVPFADIQGVALAEHPWEQMITELGSTPVIEFLAASVPQDMLYLHFHDLRSFVKTASELDEWLAPLSQAVEGRAGHPHFVERYQQQLAVERSALSEKLGHLAANGVALVVGDPFVREGTDVSLLFRVASRELLTAALAEHEANARKARPDAAERSLELAGRQVRLLETTDGAIRQYRVELGEVLILSNSAKAIERFILVADKKLPSLAEAGDFRYLRARYPFGTDTEDGYLFIGDALVAKTVGPRLKILEARRMAARSELLAINCAALLYGWLEGKRPESVETLVKAGLLSKEELQHARGGGISFTPERGAWSSWGSVAALTPIADLQGE